MPLRSSGLVLFAPGCPPIPMMHRSMVVGAAPCAPLWQCSACAPLLFCAQLSADVACVHACMPACMCVCVSACMHACLFMHVCECT